MFIECVYKCLTCVTQFAMSIVHILSICWKMKSNTFSARGMFVHLLSSQKSCSIIINALLIVSEGTPEIWILKNEHSIFNGELYDDRKIIVLKKKYISNSITMETIFKNGMRGHT